MDFHFQLNCCYFPIKWIVQLVIVCANLLQDTLRFPRELLKLTIKVAHSISLSDQQELHAHFLNQMDGIRREEVNVSLECFKIPFWFLDLNQSPQRWINLDPLRPL